MGLFSKVFKSVGTNASFLGAYRESGGQSYSGGGWGLDRFNSVVKAHSSVEGIVEEFMLDDEMCEYPSLEGYENCYTQAYEEEYERADAWIMMHDMGIAGAPFEGEPEDIMNMERVERDAYRYATQLAQAWLSGDEFVPEEVMDWAWYDLSDHNN